MRRTRLPSRMSEEEFLMCTRQTTKWSNAKIIGSVIKLCLQLAVTVTVLHFQITHRGKEPDIYYTNDPSDISRGGVTYTCGCSLPPSLQSVQNPRTNVSLNICYESSSLETVRVLMYSNSVAVPKLESTIKNIAPDQPIIYKTVEGTGYTVSQEAHDVVGAVARVPVPEEIESLYLNGYRQSAIFPSVKYLQGANFMSFPRSYARLTFAYNCDNCTTCGIEDVSNIFTSVVSNKEDGWGTCFYWGYDNHCRDENSYMAKCLLYPTEALPANFAIKRFLEKFLLLPGVSIVDQKDPTDGWVYPNSTVLEPSSLYMNISRVEDSNSSITFGFVEVLRGSALWVSLLTLLPTLGNECADMHPVKVCSGNSLCNVFTNGNSYVLKCLHMSNHTQCVDLMTQGRTSETFLDNSGHLWATYSSWLRMECPPFKCQEVAPYLVIWNTSRVMENDALNQFLSSRKLNDDWTQQSGICTNTYVDVLPYSPATIGTATSDVQGTGKYDKNTMYLQSSCMPSNESNNTATYCWLTGLYHNITDSPTDPWKILSKDLFPDPDNDRFACYRVEDQDFVTWFIITVGILFGWVGSVDFIMRYLLRWFIDPLIKFLKSQQSKQKTPEVHTQENELGQILHDALPRSHADPE